MGCLPVVMGHHRLLAGNPAKSPAQTPLVVPCVYVVSYESNEGTNSSIERGGG